MQKTIMLALLLACGAAQAADWVSLGKSNNGEFEEFVDALSVQYAGEIRRVWSKNVLQPRMQRGQGSDANKWLSYMESLMAFNCILHTMRMEANTYYFEDGSLTSTPPSELPTPWEPVPPDTIADHQMQIVCRLTPK